MLKFNLLFISAFLLSNLYSNTSNAQTKIWGVGTSVGVADAEFQNPFIQDTIGPYAPTSWTAISVYEDWGNTSPGNAFWERSLLGYSRDYYSNPPYAAAQSPLPSPSQANGVAIFDSGYMDNDSTASIGVGSSPAGHRGELISPRIDLTGYTDSALVIKFFSKFSANTTANTNELSVSLSTDDGTTWTSFDYREIQQGGVADFIAVPMPTVTAGVSNLTQCRIRFVFDTYYYYAMVDDITIEVAPDYDIAIGRPSLLNNSLEGRADIVRLGGSQYHALSNLDPNSLDEWFWGAKILNYGGKNIYPTDHPKMYVSIDFYDSANNLTADVYLDTMSLDTMLAGEYDGYLHTAPLRDINFIMNHGAGSYEVKYWVAHDNPDAFTYNDTIYHTFNVTSAAAPFISKGSLRSDGHVGMSRPFFPRGSQSNDITVFEWGSVYYFPKGQTNAINIDSVEFRHYIHRTYSGPASHTLSVNIYKLVDGSGSTAANGRLNLDELTLVAFNQITISGLDTIPAPSSGVGVVSNFVDPVTGAPFTGFDDDGWYYISVREEPSATGGPSFVTYQTGLWLGASEVNYALNAINRAPDTVINPSPLVVADVVSTNPSVYWNGFSEGTYVPSLGIHLTPDSTITTIATIENDEQAELFVSPNPASKQLTIKVEFESARDVQYIFTDAMGRVLSTFSSDQVTVETQTIDIEPFPAGVYFLTAKTDQGKIVERIIKE
ncbi:T9SS type A sorting domain-containing protein [Aureispira anguillae]|uniref:T9SS type A sorting domain-containing protein n=1 Tax=Aureispira anguillae TaxID=2864201 RepID=A0A916DT94_9BACT|nr:T9SS type A sorting domain-containing protein [Aureispira anguillae]BDS12411.1 T9SS type A sorting domain-containing protein [Aureispira anguillae]